jgi:hypothetical protein
MKYYRDLICLSAANPDSVVRSRGRAHKTALYVHLDLPFASALTLLLMTMTEQKTVFWDVTNCNFTGG